MEIQVQIKSFKTSHNKIKLGKGLKLKNNLEIDRNKYLKLNTRLSL